MNVAKMFLASDETYLQAALRAAGFERDGDWWYHPSHQDAPATAAYEAAWFRAMALSMADGFGYYVLDTQGDGTCVTFYPFCAPGG